MDSIEQQLTQLRTTLRHHGAIFPFDFINNKPLDASLAQVETYVKKIKANGAPYILLDNGDILQGQPESYVYNYVKTDVPHIISRVYNFMNRRTEMKVLE